MPRVFISYRREDSIAYAGRVYDRLSSEFGRANVFMDIDTLEPGVDFVETLTKTIASCNVFVAVIGPRWLSATDDQGNHRLSSENDFVRLEIKVALDRRNVRVVPILVGGARMPRDSELPQPISDLSRRHALELPDIGFQGALGRLILSISRDFQERPEAHDQGVGVVHPVGLDAATTETELRPFDLRGEKRRFSPAWAVAVILGSLVVAAAMLSIPRPKSAPSPLPRPSIAVAGFQNLTGQASGAQFSAIIPEYLTSELESGDTVRVAAREDVERVRRDLVLADSSGYSKASLAKFANALNYQYILSGSYSFGESNHVLRMDLRLQDTRTGETVFGFSETGTTADIGELAGRVAERVCRKIGASPSPEDQATAKAALPSGSEAARFYADGLAKLRSFDLFGARDDLQRALKADPRSALAHLALAKTFRELGYDREALKECSRARELARSLSLRDRMRIEAYYSEINGSWDKAAQTYGDLWKWYPDEAEYALDLATVQIDSSNPRAALATLDELRRTSKQAGSDPRIDLQQAEAARLAQDFSLQKRSAALALTKASAAGSKLFIATAYWESCTALVSLGDPGSAETACRQASLSADLGAGQKIKADSLSMLATMMTSQGKTSEAMELRQEALRIARQIGSLRRISAASMNLAILQFTQNQLREANANFEEAAALADQIGDRTLVLKIAVNRSDLLIASGDYFAARQGFEKALSTAESLGNKQEIANVDQRLGVILYQLGDLTQSERYLRHALALGDQLKSPDLRASSLNMLGDVLVARGEIEGARKVYTAAQDIFVKQDDRQSIAGCSESLAALAVEEGRAAAGELLARKAAEEFQKENAADSEASARETLASALLAQGKLAQAGEQIRLATNLAPEDRAVRLSIAITRAIYNSRKGDITAAKKVLDEALSQAGRLKLVGLQLEGRLALAEIERVSNPGLALTEFRSLEHDAQAGGFLLIAAKARRNLSAPAKQSAA